VHCNIDLKFGKLLRYAELIDAEFVATGHYARIVQRDGAACLARARHTPKDQSYVLFGIRRDDLRRCLFPIGELPDKQAVRELAATLDLPVHDKPDSQEICFVPDQDYRRLVAERAPETRRPGDIRDQAGRVLGRHDGVAGFTIGQRRGLGLAVGLPIYVTQLDPATNTVTVGPRDALERGGLVAQQVNWLTDPPGGEVAAAIKIRHMHTPAAGHITPAADGAVTVRFEEPQSAVTPGQAAVFYDDGGIVLGGGWIERALP
jgi:tRNA-specific 2-thiouridylase